MISAAEYEANLGQLSGVPMGRRAADQYADIWATAEQALEASETLDPHDMT